MKHVRTTHCPLDCPDACSLEVHLEDDRVVALDGTRTNPLTGGYICAKVRRFPDHLYGEDRLLYPAVRVGEKGSGEFRRVSWDEALDLVVDRMRAAIDEYGGESILPFAYGGSNGLLTDLATDDRLFRRIGASNLDRKVCAAPTTAAATEMYGKMPGVAFEDYPRAQLIVVWGCNPAVTGIHLMPYLQQAQRNGARLVVVDPRRNRLARMADLHLPVRPGTDLPVALSLIRDLFETGNADDAFLGQHARGSDRLRERAASWSFERAGDVAGVDPDAIRQLARWYVEATPAVIRCGWGLERNRNGCSAAAAVLALPAVAGKFGVRGGGYTMSNSAAFDFDRDRAAAEPPTDRRLINMNHLGVALRETTDPPIRVLFVYNCNPVATMPRQADVISGLRSSDLFTVVHEQVMTDTAAYADVLLPATTFLEHSEMHNGYGAMVLQRSEPVIDAVGEARPNYELFAELCERLGVAEPADPITAEELTATLLGGNGHAASLERDGMALPATGWAPVQFVDLFPMTGDRKIDLFPDSLDRESSAGLFAYHDDPGTADYPLALITPSTKHTVSSTFGQLVDRAAALEICAADAASRQLADGDPVRIFNELGEVQCAVRITEAMREGVVRLPKGLWRKHTLNGFTANVLAPDTLTDIADGACFNDARVQVERLA